MTGFDAAAAQHLAAEYGRDDLIEGGDFSTALYDFGQVPGKDKKDDAKVFDKVVERTKFGRVNPVKGGLASGGFTQGGATRRAPKQSTPKAGFYFHKMIEQDVELNSDIANVLDGAGGVKAVQLQIRLAGASGARLIERSIIGHELTTLSEVEAIGAAKTINCSKVAGLRPNMLVDRYASNGTTLVQADMEITDVTDNGDGTGTVTVADLTVASASGERLFIAGSGGASTPTGTKRSINIQDACSTLDPVYSGLSALDQAKGKLDSAGGSFTNRRGKRVNAALYRNCGAKATHLLVHPYQEQEVYEAQNPGLTYRPSDTMDPYGPRMLFDGAEVVICNNQDEDRVDFLNADEFAAEFHEFWAFRPSDYNGKDGSWGRNAFKEMDDRHALVAHLTEAHNLRLTRPDAFGAMTGLDVTP